ncbi:PXPV repeat protein [bacterium]|nr:PXPV repeat protein [bacterium]
MSNNRMTEGVGKKIVEALKMQSDIEITPIETPANDDFEILDSVEEPSNENDVIFEEDDLFEEEEPVFAEPQPVYTEPQPVFTEPVITPQIKVQPQQQFVASELDDFEIPSNVAVLKQLISKLPTGVTKHTGALIIKQTMEALGISMKSVLQEAQQVQEGLNNSSRECQASILEYKKQIGILEKQAQKYQRQYAALNDIISLFVQTNI